MSKAFDGYAATYAKSFANYTLQEELILGPVRLFHLRRPGHGRAEGVDLLFTKTSVGERIFITGDLAPNDNEGCISHLGYGLEWFTRQTDTGHLCSKLLRRTWVPDVALEELRVWLTDRMHDAHTDAITEAVKAGTDWPAPASTAEAFGEWYLDTFHDSPENAGYDYHPREAALLAAIQATFARLYALHEQPGGPPTPGLAWRSRPLATMSDKKSLGSMVITLEDGSTCTFSLTAEYWQGRKNVLAVRDGKDVWTVFELPCAPTKVVVYEVREVHDGVAVMDEPKGPSTS